METQVAVFSFSATVALLTAYDREAGQAYVDGADRGELIGDC